MISVMRRVMQRLSRGRGPVTRTPAASPDHAMGYLAAIALIGALVLAVLLTGIVGR